MSSFQIVLANAKKIGFTLKGVRVQCADFGLVAVKIFSQKVSVKRQVVSGDYQAAHYDPAIRKLTIWTTSANFPSNSYEESLIVHEAVHVAGHIHKRRGLPLAEEMAAYVAQGMYLLLYESKVTPAQAGDRAKIWVPTLLQKCNVNKECSEAQLVAATVIAAELMQKRTPTGPMLRDLQSALEADPTYTSVLSRPLKYETGIP